MDLRYDPNLVLSLPLYELDGASFMSRDHYGHLATVTGAPWSLQGRPFDGIDDQINAGAASALNIVGNVLALEAWMKTTNASATERGILGKATNGTNEGYFLELFTDHKPAIWLSGSGGATRTKGTTVVNNGNWYHIVGTYDGTTVRIYVNSIQENSEARTANLVTTAQSLYIGSAYAAALFLAVTIGEIRVYSRALTAQEIQRNYLATKWRYQ